MMFTLRIRTHALTLTLFSATLFPGLPLLLHAQNASQTPLAPFGLAGTSWKNAPLQKEISFGWEAIETREKTRKTKACFNPIYQYTRTRSTPTPEIYIVVTCPAGTARDNEPPMPERWRYLPERKELVAHNTPEVVFTEAHTDANHSAGINLHQQRALRLVSAITPEQFLKTLETLQAALHHDNRKVVARHIHYPLSIATEHTPLVLHNEKNFLTHYDTVMTPAIVTTIMESTLASISPYENGVLLGNRVWLGLACPHGPCKKEHLLLTGLG